jgi:tRNA(fMet)-specific endonuclease VapC
LLLLDTDHFSEWERDTAVGKKLRARLGAAKPDLAVTIITVEERLRGWLAEIARLRDPHNQIAAYSRLQRQVEVLADWLILPWDPQAAQLFLDLRRQRVRIGSLDLKIACVALVYDVTLLTRNSKDFGKVPGLQFENWLD